MQDHWVKSWFADGRLETLQARHVHSTRVFQKFYRVIARDGEHISCL
jgi:hypothetical protein